MMIATQHPIGRPSSEDDELVVEVLGVVEEVVLDVVEEVVLVVDEE